MRCPCEGAIRKGHMKALIMILFPLISIYTIFFGYPSDIVALPLVGIVMIATFTYIINHREVWR